MIQVVTDKEQGDRDAETSQDDVLTVCPGDAELELLPNDQRLFSGYFGKS